MAGVSTFDGSKNSVTRSLASDAVPLMAEPPEGVTVMMLLTTAGSIGAVNFTITWAFSGTLAAVLAGEIEATLGATRSEPLPVVKYVFMPFR